MSSLTVRLLLLGARPAAAAGTVRWPHRGGRGRVVRRAPRPGADLGLRRELALLLARTAERERGPAQVSAVRELRDLARQAVGETDARWRVFLADLATPVYTTDNDEEEQR